MKEKTFENLRKSEIPLITIGITCFNAEKTIARSLLSVISQSYKNWKILIRDDMSTDKTRAIIDNIIRVFGLQERIIVETNKEKKWEVC